MAEHRRLKLTAVQADPFPITGNLEDFKAQVGQVLAQHPDTDLLVYPELHLHKDGTPDQARTEALLASAEPLDGPRVQALQELARHYGIWFCPGSLCELGPEGELFNTQIIIDPQGQLVSSYRKIFPWRPSEPYAPGTSFSTFDLPGYGRIGLNICYDAWFPETSRQLTWMGAQLILNVVKTTTPDRAQELILAQANAIVNQVYIASVNVAAPTGEGQSIIVGPQGEIIAQAQGKGEEVLTAVIDFDEVERVRREGTAGTNRMWNQFHPGESPIPLPIYGGRIDPATWTPQPTHPEK